MSDAQPTQPTFEALRSLMRSKAARWGASALTLLGLTLAGPLLGLADGPTHPPRASTTTVRAQTATAERRARPRIVQGVNLAERRLEDDAYVVDTARGETAFLSLDAGLQQHLEAYFARYEVPEAGLVAMDPTTGRVLAYINHRGRDTAAADMATSSGPPAASVFKIITGALGVGRHGLGARLLPRWREPPGAWPSGVQPRDGSHLQHARRGDGRLTQCRLRTPCGSAS